MSERVCLRGCTVRDVHFAACPSLAGVEGPEVRGGCGGCKPALARDHAYICDRCYRALSRHLHDAADVVGELRSRADPMKSGWNFDRLVVSSSSGEVPAPVRAVLIDAGDSIVRMLAEWAQSLCGARYVSRYAVHGLAAGAETADAFDVVSALTGWLLADLDSIVNTLEVKGFADAVLTRHAGDPVGWEWWSVADALVRFPLNDRAGWAAIACPECDIKQVRVMPPRRAGGSARYTCLTVGCEWERTDRDDAGLWAELFEGKRPGDLSARDVPLGDKDLTSAHDDRWLTLADAARLAKRTTGTVRAWATAGEVRAELGRYWREDVEAVRDERNGVAVVAAPDETKEVEL